MDLENEITESKIWSKSQTSERDWPSVKVFENSLMCYVTVS
jgi:hypothetical protein